MNHLAAYWSHTTERRDIMRVLLLASATLAGLAAADIDTVCLDLGMLPTNYKASSTLSSPVLNASSDSSGNADSSGRLGVLGLIRKQADDNIYTAFGLGAGMNVWKDTSHSPAVTNDEANATTGYLDGYVGPSFAFYDNRLLVDVLGFIGYQMGNSDEKVDYPNGTHIDSKGTVKGAEYGARLNLSAIIDRRFIVGLWAGYYETKLKMDNDLTATSPAGTHWIATGTSTATGNMTTDYTTRGFMGGISAGIAF